METLTFIHSRCTGTLRVLLAFVTLGLGAGWVRGADEPASSVEYQVKAGLLINFAKFVEWPANAQTNSSKFRIGIVDDDKAFPVIAEEMAGKTIGSREIEVVRVKSTVDPKSFNIVFVTRSQAKRTEAVLKAVGTAPVLTVGEREGFAADGGCINFVLIGKKIRFEVNTGVAEKAGLKISSKIASMATLVGTKEGGK